MNSNGIRVAIVGATGVVGQEMLSILEESGLAVSDISLLASENSAGEIYKFREDQSAVETLGGFDFGTVQVVLFAGSSELAEKHIPGAIEKGATVIDNSRFFRMDPNVPLVVPEVNFESIKPEHRIIANPNCSTIQLVPVLKILHDFAGLKRVVVSTYQAVSGAGRAALDELFEETRAVFSQESYERECFQHQIAFNCIPAIDTFLESGYTREEIKIIDESRKILGVAELPITATAVRVPVFNAHAESVNIEFDSEISAEKAIELLQGNGIAASSNPEEFPMQSIVSGQDKIAVGRVRLDESVAHGLNLWIVADNLRKGAALNAVQILERLVSEQPERFSGAS